MIEVLIVVMLVALALCILVAGLIESAFNRTMAVALCGIVLLFSAAIAGKEAGKKKERLPDLSGLCRPVPGSGIRLSWKVADEDVEAVRRALNEDARCNVKVTRNATPPAFPKPTGVRSGSGT